MNIIKEFQKYPHAWDAFMEWAEKNSFFFDAWHTKAKIEQRYLLADMQSWLDSVEIYCDAKPNKRLLNEDTVWQPLLLRGWLCEELYVSGTCPTRPEALKAAVLKGCEIFENSKTQ